MMVPSSRCRVAVPVCVNIALEGVAYIEQAIETKIYEGLLVGEDDIYAIIGFDTDANPIEVFYNSIDDETIKVFHAMALRDNVASQMYKKG